MKGKKKKELSFDQKSANAELILAGKKIAENGKELFEDVLKKAATPKKAKKKIKKKDEFGDSYKKFIKGKEYNPEGAHLFAEPIKKEEKNK